MKFTELVDSGASKTKQHEYLVDGNQTTITIRISSNFKEVVVEAATLKGLNFSAFARICMIDGVGKERLRQITRMIRLNSLRYADLAT